MSPSPWCIIGYQRAGRCPPALRCRRADVSNCVKNRQLLPACVLSPIYSPMLCRGVASLQLPPYASQRRASVTVYHPVTTLLSCCVMTPAIVRKSHRQCLQRPLTSRHLHRSLGRGSIRCCGDIHKNPGPTSTKKPSASKPAPEPAPAPPSLSSRSFVLKRGTTASPARVTTERGASPRVKRTASASRERDPEWIASEPTPALRDETVGGDNPTREADAGDDSDATQTLPTAPTHDADAGGDSAATQVLPTATSSKRSHTARAASSTGRNKISLGSGEPATQPLPPTPAAHAAPSGTVTGTDVPIVEQSADQPSSSSTSAPPVVEDTRPSPPTEPFAQTHQFVPANDDAPFAQPPFAQPTFAQPTFAQSPFAPSASPRRAATFDYDEDDLNVLLRPSSGTRRQFVAEQTQPLSRPASRASPLRRSPIVGTDGAPLGGTTEPLLHPTSNNDLNFNARISPSPVPFLFTPTSSSFFTAAPAPSSSAGRIKGPENPKKAFFVLDGQRFFA